MTAGENWVEVDVDDDVVEVDEEASPLEQAQAIVGVEGGLDPLSALLAVDPDAPIVDTWFCKRLGVTFTYSAFTDDKDYERVIDRATIRRKRRGGAPTKEVDNRVLSKLTIVDRCVDPVFDPARDGAKFKKLADHFGALDPEMLVGKALLPGEIDTLAEKILILSGYDDDMEDAAGNS